MSETLRDLLPLVAALAGVVVGGIVAELRTILQGRRERGQALARLLNQLLEIRYRVCLNDPDTIPSVLRKYIEGRFGPIASVELEAPEAKELLRRLVRALRDSTERDPIAEAYKAAVDSVAPYEPVMAYRLRDLDRHTALDVQITGYYTQMSQLPGLADDSQAPVSLEHLEETTIRIAYADVRDELARLIRVVAWGISLSTRLRIGPVLARQDRLPDKDLMALFDRLLQTLSPRG